MKQIVLDIGSPEWLQAFTASKAPAMMNDSKYQSRNELLEIMKTGNSKPVTDQQQALFNKGHEAENEARTILEMEECEDYPAVTGMIEIDGLTLIASFDGLSAMMTPWEHKLWNETLSENVQNKVLEPHYFWQLEHQCLVAGASFCIFTTSDGTDNKRESMIYHSLPELRQALIVGWKQFAIDLENYEITAKSEPVIAKEVESFPMIEYSVSGADIVSNINNVLASVKERAAVEMSRVLETDQDFADKDKLNKAVKKSRADLKNLVESVKGEFVSFADFSNVAVELDSVLQKMQSHGEKQVKEAKDIKKQAIINDAARKFNNFTTGSNEIIKPLDIFSFPGVNTPEWIEVVKNKRTIESIQNAVDSELSKAQQPINELLPKIQTNLVTLRELAGDYKFLFTDTVNLVQQDSEALKGMIKLRIDDHKKLEYERLEKEREHIRQEEAAKAEAKLKAEQAEKELEEESERIKKSKDFEKDNVEPPVITESIEGEPVSESEPINKEPVEAVSTFQQDLSEWGDLYHIEPDAMAELLNMLSIHGININEAKAA